MPANWNDLNHKASPAVRARLRKEAHAALERSTGFARMRRARHQTQAAIARIEKQAKILLGPLAEDAEALGGRLWLRGVFREGDFLIENFGKEKPSRKPPRSA